MFEEQHLNLVGSKYFGARGASKQNLDEHPIPNILFQGIDASINKELISAEGLFQLKWLWFWIFTL